MTHLRHWPNRNPAAQQSPAVPRCAILSEAWEGPGSEPALVHHGVRRRGGRVAARSARAAGRAHAADRRDYERSCGRSGMTSPHRNVPSGTTGMGLDARPQRTDRRALGCGRCRQQSSIRGGTGRARARCHSRLSGRSGRSAPTDDPHDTDCVCDYHRSGWRRVRRELGTSGPQHNWI